MPWYTLNSLSSPQSLSVLDTQFGNVAEWGRIICSAAGTNAIELSPSLSGFSAPVYATGHCYFFVAAASSTGAVTLKVGAQAAKNVYRADGSTQIAAGDVVAGRAYAVTYNSALNLGAGGWYLNELGGSSGGGSGGTTVEFRLSSATVTIPNGATRSRVTLVGGGGGGGGTLTAGCAGGGGGGATCIKYLTGLTPGNTLSLTIGAAGSGGAAGDNSGGAGGNTTLSSGTQTITTLTAGGGAGGSSGSGGYSAPAGSGGTATNGDLNISGGKGFAAILNAGPNTNYVCISQGGGSMYAAPVTTAAAGTAANGAAAVGYGGGGAGGVSPALAGAAAGGNGSQGLAIFEWYS
jgi:hypothetical protein